MTKDFLCYIARISSANPASQATYSVNYVLLVVAIVIVIVIVVVIAIAVESGERSQTGIQNKMRSG
jgi:hypothetical protein